MEFTYLYRRIQRKFVAVWFNILPQALMSIDRNLTRFLLLMIFGFQIFSYSMGITGLRVILILQVVTLQVRISFLVYALRMTEDINNIFWFLIHVQLPMTKSL
jgi:succinate-acetate transporter protein